MSTDHCSILFGKGFSTMLVVLFVDDNDDSSSSSSEGGNPKLVNFAGRGKYSMYMCQELETQTKAGQKPVTCKEYVTRLTPKEGLDYTGLTAVGETP